MSDSLIPNGSLSLGGVFFYPTWNVLCGLFYKCEQTDFSAILIFAALRMDIFTTSLYAD